MAYSSKVYQKLKSLGYAADTAHKMASWGQERLKTEVKNDMLSLLQYTDTKITRKQKYQIARLFGFSSKQADKIKSLSNKNIISSIKTNKVISVRDIYNQKGNIKYLKALENNFLVDDARLGNRYLYQVHYKVYYGDDLYSQEKYLSVISRKKLSEKEVIKKTIEILSQYDEEYKTSVDKSSITIDKAYYMSKYDYKKLIDRRKKEK